MLPGSDYPPASWDSGFIQPIFKFLYKVTEKSIGILIGWRWVGGAAGQPVGGRLTEVWAPENPGGLTLLTHSTVSPSTGDSPVLWRPLQGKS